MLPETLADLSFADHPADRWDDLASRVTDALPHSGADLVMLLGVDSIALLLSLLGEGLELVCVDSSRSALARARDAVDEPGRVEFLAQDPRELEVPGGADVALIASLTLRAIVLGEDRVRVLRAIGGELRPGGALCIELEALPSGESGTLTSPSGAALAWRRLVDPVEVLRITEDGADGPVSTGLDIAAFDADALRAELSEADFESIEATEDGGRTWLVARIGGGAA